MADGQKDLIDPNKYFTNTLHFMENSILAFLQGLFGNFETGQYHFDYNEDVSEIKISGRGTDNLKNVDTRPAIIVVRGPVSWQGRGLGGGSFVGSANLSMHAQRYADINSGTVGISCFSREELEADRLANICYDSIKFFRPVLQKYGYLSIHAAQIGQRAMIKNDSRPELSVTPVLVQMEITKNWSLDRMDPVKLKKILLSYALQVNGQTVEEI